MANYVNAQSDNAGVYDLKRVIDYSLENNLSSTVYENNIEMTKQQNLEGLSRYLPQINAFFNFDYNAKLQTTVIPAGGFSPKEVRIQMGNPFVSGTGIQLDQKLYDQSNIVALKARKYNLEFASLKQQQNDVDIIYNASIAYYQVLTVEQQARLLLENKKQYDDLLRIMALQLEKGVIRKLDYDRTKVALNNITSQLALLETNKVMATNQLKMAMGMPFDGTLEIDTTQLPEDITMPQDESFSSENRLDYQILNQQMVLQEYDYKMKKMAVVPTLSAYARYGANAYSKEFGTAFNNWFDYSSVGLKLNVPIFNGMRASAQMKQSKLTMENLKQNIKISQLSNQLEFQSAKTKLFSSYLSYNQDKDNMMLAKDVYDASLVEYQQGQSSLTDFLNSDYSLKQAQSNYINSMLNFLSARLAYEKAKGTLTDYVGQL
jgi:outer membrane protein TolC